MHKNRNFASTAQTHSNAQTSPHPSQQTVQLLLRAAAAVLADHQQGSLIVSQPAVGGLQTDA